MDRFLNSLSLRRRPSALRSLTALIMNGPKDLISLATGMPNTELFPFHSANFTLTSGKTLNISPEKMKTALQYGPSTGYQPLLGFIKELQSKVHKYDYAKSSSIVTNGSQDGLSKAFDMLVENGDNVLIEAPTYPGVLATINPLPCNICPIESDEFGIIPESLEKTIQSLTRKPKVLYVCPIGANPTGACAPIERKSAVYSITQKHDILILEDDPYYFIQFEQSHPSYLSIDTDGRVLRFDSFSKLLSSGLRLGFATGPSELISRLELHEQASNMHPSNLAQVLVSTLFEQWKIDGFLDHTQKVANFYKLRRDNMVEAVDKHLSNHVEFSKPNAGMFLWLKCKHVEDTSDLIGKKALAEKVVLVPGNVFYVDSQNPSPHMRAAYSLASQKDMNLACERLARILSSK